MPDEVVAAIIGASATIAAALLGVGFRRTFRHSEGTGQDLGLRILAPASGAVGEGQIEVTGTYDVLPADGSMFLMTASMDKKSYWPQVPSNVEFHRARRTWSGKVWSRGDARILAVTAGSGGRSLFRYYEKVGSRYQDWLPVDELPNDVIEHDEIIIKSVPSEVAG